MTAEALISSQLKGVDEFASLVQPYFLKISDVVRGVTLPMQPSDDIIRAIGHLVRLGNFPEVAARALGVRTHLFREWVALGLKDPHSSYGRLVAAIDIADAQDEISDVQLITIGVKHWSALAWKRERKTARRWKPKFEHTIIGTDDYGGGGTPKYEHVPDANTAESILQTLQDLGVLHNVMPLPTKDSEAPVAEDEDEGAG